MSELYCYDTGFDVECIPYNFEKQTVISDMGEILIEGILSFGLLLLFLTMLLEMFSSIKILTSKKDKPKYLVTIIRGLPGSGKTNLVYNLEEYREKVYSICNSNDYFYDDGSYRFNSKQINNSENYCFNKFLNSMKDKIGRIYVLGNFNKKWMYENYKLAAELNNYNVRVIEMDCPSKNHLKYFNVRCKYNFPLKKALTVYKEWEIDEDALLQEPYIEELPGDSLPSLKKITKEQLDKELDNFLTKSQECFIDSDDDNLTNVSDETERKLCNLNNKFVDEYLKNDVEGYEVEFSDEDVTNKNSNVLNMFDDELKTMFH